MSSLSSPWLPWSPWSLSRPALLVLVGALSAPLPAFAGQPSEPARRGVAPAPTPARPQVDSAQGDSRLLLAGDENARETKVRLGRLLDQYPPTLREVLRRDPSLLRSDPYLAPYPALGAFLAQHPEVGHNPFFFLGGPERDFYAERNPSSERISAVRSMFESLTVMLALMAFFAMVGWVTKSIIDQRRWARASKVQNEAHAKVIDRLASNEDLLAYIQTPAGQRYLESAPLSTGAAVPSPVSAPYSRILWSVQAGTVASLVGVGFLFVSARWATDVEWAGDFSRMLFLVGVVALAAGVGFVLSGFTSYTLARRFGLIQSPTAPHA